MANFDRAISPGGEGKVTLTLDLKNLQGPVRKSAIIFSNDPQKPQISLGLLATVRPHIEVRPASYVLFKGTKEGEQEKEIDIMSTVHPFKILRIENTLGEKIKYQMESLGNEKQYRLKIRCGQSKERFAGKLKIFTNHPKKPEIQILIRYILEG